MGKIMVSKGTKTAIILVVVVVFFGGYLMATGQGVGEFVSGIWAKFMNLLGGNIE
jgi:hypothetical protein